MGVDLRWPNSQHLRDRTFEMFVKQKMKNKPNVNIVESYDINQEQKESVYF